jgi:glycosyltransferase involved in cell wall biosynthesis
MGYHQRISIVTPTYNPEERWLRKCLGSVIDQIYDDWELCIADDASEGKDVRFVLEEYAGRDRRIKTKFLSTHVGIVGASNEGLSLATGEFVGFLDHDDELTRDALYEVAKLLNMNPDLDFIYTDEDVVGKHGVRSTRFLKPDWSPDLLMSYNYLPHFSVYRRSIVDQMGGFRPGYDGSQDYDLVLRFTERTGKIGHLPKPLYRWRKARGSVASSVDAKPYAYQAAIKALHEAAKRRGFDAEVREVHRGGRYRVRYSLVAKPFVSILIPTRDSSSIRRCLQSVGRSTYRNLDLLVLDWSTGDSVRKVAGKFGGCRLMKYDVSRPPSFSRIANSGTLMTNGEYLIFLKDSD